MKTIKEQLLKILNEDFEGGKIHSCKIYMNIEDLKKMIHEPDLLNFRTDFRGHDILINHTFLCTYSFLLKESEVSFVASGQEHKYILEIDDRDFKDLDIYEKTVKNYLESSVSFSQSSGLWHYLFR